jgi:hypothetical protein
LEIFYLDGRKFPAVHPHLRHCGYKAQLDIPRSRKKVGTSANTLILRNTIRNAKNRGIKFVTTIRKAPMANTDKSYRKTLIQKEIIIDRNSLNDFYSYNVIFG